MIIASSDYTRCHSTVKEAATRYVSKLLPYFKDDYIGALPKT